MQSNRLVLTLIPVTGFAGDADVTAEEAGGKMKAGFVMEPAVVSGLPTALVNVVAPPASSSHRLQNTHQSIHH
jgi:hypothetical protein